MTEASQIDARRYLQKLNTTHAAQREADLELEARIAAYELAARLQLSAPEVADLNGETQSTLQNYGIGEEPTDDFGRRCLLARRMVERGVRFVHVWCGADEATTVREDWDAHDDLVKNHGLMGKTFDKPAAALLKDLKARGLLGETLVICATEFGRMPAAQEALGRDHNPNAFTCWMAGAGVKGGVSYGKTDDFSYKVIKNPVQCHDLHATALHLLGVDHTKLTYRHNSVKRRLTDVHGHVISKILT